MKMLITFILAVALAMGTTGLFAQTKVVANVPFDFTVSTVTMPAGAYTLQSTGAAGHVIQIVNNETGKSVLVLAPCMNSSYKGKATDTGKVIFDRYGDRYFFSEVWTPYGLRGHAMPGKLEKELQASNSDMQMASVSIPLTTEVQ
jgi:hypothetical protein